MANSVKLIPVPRLKDYVFTDKLGSGTYATVYKAYKKKTITDLLAANYIHRAMVACRGGEVGPREVVAVKCVLKSSLNSVSTENLLTEINLLKTLRHENIVQLKDFSWDDDYIYLIMEYCSGGDLSRFIRARRALPEFIAKRFLQQLALALQYMRAKNVSHMDLKPQNILLSTQHTPHLKIADFGFAHYLLGDTEAAFIRGSPLYMAPEMVLKRNYNEKADLWSTGIIVYECIFGRAPFASRSLKEVADKIKDTKPIELPYGVEISGECRDLLLGLLQRDPDKRMSYDDFLSHPFIDLKHRPSADALKTAISLATEAVNKDNGGDLPGAVTLYCQALEYFVPAIHYEHDPKKKQHLRSKVQEYMARAEELKHAMKPPLPSGQHVGDVVVTDLTEDDSIPTATAEQCEGAGVASVACSNMTPQEELDLLCSVHPHLKAAVTVLHSAQEKEGLEDYDGALNQYELALETMIKSLKEEPKGARRKALQSQISRWMYHAEAIKKYIQVKDLHTKDSSETEEKDTEHFFRDSIAGSCSIQ